MALRDDLLAGESYYIVETRSLKRILDAAAESGGLLKLEPGRRLETALGCELFLER